MTARQENNLNRVRKILKEARELLDGVMYGGDPLTEKELSNVRESHSWICKANDKL